MYYAQKLIVVKILKIFEHFKPLVLTLLDRYKVPFYHKTLEENMGYLVSKDGQKRREPFRVKFKQLNESTSFKVTTIQVWAYKAL